MSVMIQTPALTFLHPSRIRDDVRRRRGGGGRPAPRSTRPPLSPREDAARARVARERAASDTTARVETLGVVVIARVTIVPRRLLSSSSESNERPTEHESTRVSSLACARCDRLRSRVGRGETRARAHRSTVARRRRRRRRRRSHRARHERERGDGGPVLDGCDASPSGACSR